MIRYVLDTQLYIEASREREKAEDLKSFTSAFLPFLYLHAVVSQELLAGATSPQWQEEIQRNVIAPFEKRGRLLVPSYAAWRRSGEMIAELVIRKRRSPGGLSRSFLDDAVLAASCRESGMTLITRNRSDFELLAEVEPVRFVEPWPRT